MISATVSSLTFPCTCCEAIILSQQPVHHGIPVWIDHPFQAPELPEALPEQLAMVWQ
jgi:hypothetical protein